MDDSQPKGEPGSSSDPSPLVVREDSLEFGGRVFSLPCSSEAIVKIFGAPSRSILSANLIPVWDNRGIFVHMDPEHPQVGALSIAIRPFDAPHWPREIFTGQITIGHDRITSTTSPDELEQLGFEDVGFILWHKTEGAYEIDVQTDGSDIIAVSITKGSDLP